MIALGGAVGTGLIIGSGMPRLVLGCFWLNRSTGTALRRGGPLGILVGYSFVGKFIGTLAGQ